MRASVFNYFLRVGDAKTAIYNTLNRSFVEASEEDFQRLESGCESFQEGELQMLLANGFLVDDSFDERGFLSYQFDRTRYANETFAITIAPTLSCNFACAYCYENPRDGKLDDASFDAIAAFVEENYATSGFKKLQVNWYGGEPMLCVEAIGRWSQRLIKFAEEHSIDYCSHMITNGSLVNKDNIRTLVESRITNVQVTINGWGDKHDKRRPARNGEKQFNRILEAVTIMAGAGIEVSCRMNVDKINLSDYERVSEHFSGIGNVYVHIGHLRDYSELDSNEFRCFSCADFSKSEFDVFKRSGYDRDDLENIFSSRRMFCGACTENSYVVDELCNVYKCWNDIGNDEMVIFNLLENPESRKVNYGALLRYMKWDPFADEHCSTCKWMPICGGGCIFETNQLGEPFCYPPTYSIDKYSELYYEEVNSDEVG